MKKEPRCSEWKTQFCSIDVVCKQCSNYNNCKLDIDGGDETIICEPTSEKRQTKHFGEMAFDEPGTAVNIKRGETQTFVEIYHFYYKDGKTEITDGTTLVGIAKGKELDKLVEILKKVQSDK